MKMQNQQFVFLKVHRKESTKKLVKNFQPLEFRIKMAGNIYESIMIHFIRKDTIPNPTGLDMDDKVIITPTGSEEEYIVKTTFSAIQYPSRVPKETASVMKAFDIVTYIASMIELVRLDNIPFESVQFDFPNIPSILIDHSNLINAKDTVIQLLDVTLRNWPKQVVLTPKKPKTPLTVPGAPERPSSVSHLYPPRHLFFDDNDAMRLY